MTPLSNAYLLKITGPGATGRSGDPGPGVDLWEGRAAGYLQQIRGTRLSGGVQVKFKQDVFTILTAAGSPVIEAAGPDWEATTIEVEDRRIPRSPVTRTFRVDSIELRAAGTSVDSLRLEVDEL